MIDNGAPANVAQVVFGESALEQSECAVRLRGADGSTLPDYGKRQIWLNIRNQLKRYEFHVADVTNPMLSVSYLCENEIETHLARQLLLTCGSRSFTTSSVQSKLRCKTQLSNICRILKSKVCELKN